MRPIFVHYSLLTLALCVAPFSVAKAGFEFIPPSGSARAPQAPTAMDSSVGMTPAPASSVVSEALSSAAAQTAPQSILPTDNGMGMSAPAPMMPPAAPSRGPVINMNPLGSASMAQSSDGMQVGKLEQAMMQPATGTASVAPVQAAPISDGRAGLGGMPLPPAMPPAMTAPSGTYTEAVGFGKDLPLALAVSQIVPPDYTFSFDGQINPGDPVSWEGGRPWDVVLNDTLSGMNASARIDEAKKEVIIAKGAAAPIPAAYTPPAPMMPRPPTAAPAPVSMMTPPPVATVRDVQPVAAVPAISSGMSADQSPQVHLTGLNKSNVLDAKAVRLWEAQRGTSLRSILTEWSLQSGVELFWSSDFDFPVESTIRIKGTFEDAVQTLLNGLRDAQPRPIGRLHPNLPEGPSVLVIETKTIIE